jgi:hypothetical protein
MIEQLEKDKYISTDTKIFTLVEIENFEQMFTFQQVQQSWNRYGYELKKSLIPPQVKMKDGTFNFRLNFHPDLALPLRTYYYGLVNALRKGRIQKEPFIIINFDAKLRKPITKDWVNQVEKFHTLSGSRKAKEGILIRPETAIELVNYFVDEDTVLDQGFSHLYDDKLIPGFNIKTINPIESFIGKA